MRKNGAAAAYRSRCSVFNGRQPELLPATNVSYTLCRKWPKMCHAWPNICPFFAYRLQFGPRLAFLVPSLAVIRPFVALFMPAGSCSTRNKANAGLDKAIFGTSIRRALLLVRFSAWRLS
jgi:hypothetical protein